MFDFTKTIIAAMKIYVDKIASKIPTKISQLENDKSYATLENVPNKVSDLENDSGYLNKETDPTVPEWAKQSTKPKYTAKEVGAMSREDVSKAISSIIPTVTIDDNGKILKVKDGVYTLISHNDAFVLDEDGYLTL